MRRNGETRVRLTSPLHVIDRMEEMMDENLRRQLAEQRIDVEELAAQARRNAYRPQEVFTLDSVTPEGEKKEVRVWLE